jgi:hypothetical protein
VEARKRGKRVQSEIVGTDPMHRVIDTGREFAPPPDVDMVAHESKVERVGEALRTVSAEAFARIVREAVAIAEERPSSDDR